MDADLELVVIRFDVLGTPAPKGSSRAIMIGGRAQVVPNSSTKNAAEQRAWASAVRDQALLSCGESPPFVRVPVRVAVVFRMPRPSGHYHKKSGALKPGAPRFPAVRPDSDKILRCTLDALTGVVFDDDSRIIALSSLKLYAEAAPGASIAVAAMDSGEAVAA